jgi:hypothetical protein
LKQSTCAMKGIIAYGKENTREWWGYGG